MIVRPVYEFDSKEIERLNQLQDFKLKDLNNCIIDRIVTEDNKIIAYGIVKRTAEAIILVNPSFSVLKRAEAMQELMKYAEAGAKKEQCYQLNCFVSSLKLVQTLEKKFGFKRTLDYVVSKDI